MDTLLASSCVVYDVCIQSRPIQMLAGIQLNFSDRDIALVKLLDTPPGGRMELQCEGPSGPSPHLLRAGF